MAYCTFAEVQEKVPHIQISASSEPTQDDVENWIEQASNGIIDPQIRSKITLPVSDTVGLEYLRNVAINWVVGEIYRAVETGSETAVAFTTIAQKLLEAILEDPEIIQTPTTSVAEAKPTFQPRTPDPSTGEIVFRRGEKQW